jgi:uncharacterized membrane protein
MRVLMALVPMLMLAGCGSDEVVNDTANQAAPKPMRGPKLGDVDLSRPVHASGVSPAWSMKIMPGQLTYADSADGTGKGTDFYPVTPKADADHAVFDTQTPEGTPVTITLTRTECREGGEAGPAQPLTAELRIGERVLKGCAQPSFVDTFEAPPANDTAPAPAPAANASAGG